MKPLFHKQLYFNEEEYEFFSVDVPANFWETKNICLEYRRLFQYKLETGLKDYLYNFLDENYNVFDLTKNFVENFNGKGFLDNREILSDAAQKFIKHLSDLLEQYSGLSEMEISYFIDDPFDVIAEHLCEQSRIAYLINDFCDRLKCIQNKTGLKECFEQYGITDENHDGFLNKIVSESSFDLIFLLTYAFEHSDI